jgi:hypothetical protein
MKRFIILLDSRLRGNDRCDELREIIKHRAFGYRDLDYFKLKIYNLHTTRYSKT